MEDLDPSTVPQWALKHRSLQYQERLEELRAEARELLQNYGDQFMDEAFGGRRSTAVLPRTMADKVGSGNRCGGRTAEAVASCDCA